MSKKDIRWIQRLNNYCAALDGLKEEVELSSERTLSFLEKKASSKALSTPMNSHGMSSRIFMSRWVNRRCTVAKMHSASRLRGD